MIRLFVKNDKKFRFISMNIHYVGMSRLNGINKRSILMYAGALTVAGIASLLLFTAIASPMLQSAELYVSRYDVNHSDYYGLNEDLSINKNALKYFMINCPLSSEEEKKLGFVTLTQDDLKKVPRLKQLIDDLDKWFEHIADNKEYINYDIKISKDESTGCYIYASSESKGILSTS